MELSKGIRIAGDSRAQLATDLKAKYEQGASIRSLAECTGRSYGFVHQVLNEAEVTLRGRGRTSRRASSS